MSQQDSRPIFIVGAPRSGTSLLRAMLNRHPSIALCDETYFFYYVYQRRRTFGNLGRDSARRLLVERYLATDRIRRLRLDKKELADVLIAQGMDYPEVFAALLRFYARAHGKHRWGEKTPQHALVARTLCEWYPQATLVHIVRDPRDVVASLVRMPWGRRSIVLNTHTWMSCAEGAERARDLPNYLLVRYESLIDRPHQELQRLCTAIGETYTTELLDPSPTPSADHWWFERAQGPLTTKRKQAYRKQLSPEQVGIIEHLTAPLLHRFGYETAEAAPSRAAVFAARREAAVELLASRLRSLPRAWYHWFRPADLAAEEAFTDSHTRPLPPAEA